MNASGDSVQFCLFQGERLLYCDHVESEGLFNLACDHDLEGIVAKRKFDPYLPEPANWLKIRNQSYSQWVGREELFERDRERSPEFVYWDNCARALTDYVNQSDDELGFADDASHC